MELHKDKGLQVPQAASLIQKQTRVLNGAPVVMFFSAGKDAIVAAHLLRQHHKGKIYWLHMFFVDGLEVIEPSLKYYEKRWGIDIIRRPCDEALSLQAELDGKKRTKYNYSDTEKMYRDELREEFGVEWLCDGKKANDSFSARMQMTYNRCKETGINYSMKRIHPVLNWTDKKVFAYCRINKLPLPKTYSMGMDRSIWIPDANLLIWMKAHFSEDYKKIINRFPQCGDAVFKKIGTV